MNDPELQMYAEAQECYKRGRKYGQDITTVSSAIDEFREAVAKFEVLNQALPASVALTDLGAQLVNRAWRPPNLVNLGDAAEAEQVLSRALERLSRSNDPSRARLEANALAWRARARTLLAEQDLSKNEMALTDAQRAISLMPAEPDKPETKHDLALAHLHLARAHFFRASLASRPTVARGCLSRLIWSRRRRKDIAKVRQHAGEALRLDPGNRHIHVQGSWLFENAERV